MKTLLIETSQSTGAIALASEGKILSSHTFGQSPGALKILLPSIQTLLREHNWELKELCRIAVGIGPGSYTGMRVGITVAQTLAFALKLPFTSFCSLFAFIPPEAEGTFAYVCATKKGDYFVAKGVKEKNAKLTILMQEYAPVSALPLLLADVGCIVTKDPLPLTRPTLVPSWNPAPLLSYIADKSPATKAEALYFS